MSDLKKYDPTGHEFEPESDAEKTLEIPVEEMRKRIAKSYPDLEPYESGTFPVVRLPDEHA